MSDKLTDNICICILLYLTVDNTEGPVRAITELDTFECSILNSIEVEIVSLLIQLLLFLMGHSLACTLLHHCSQHSNFCNTSLVDYQ